MGSFDIPQPDQRHARHLAKAELPCLRMRIIRGTKKRAVEDLESRGRGNCTAQDGLNRL